MILDNIYLKVSDINIYKLVTKMKSTTMKLHIIVHTVLKLYFVYIHVD